MLGYGTMMTRYCHRTLKHTPAKRARLGTSPEGTGSSSHQSCTDTVRSNGHRASIVSDPEVQVPQIQAQVDPVVVQNPVAIPLAAVQPEAGLEPQNAAAQEVLVRSFPGAKIQEIADYAKPTVRQKPKTLIIHAGTNDILHKSPRELAEQLVDISRGISDSLPESKLALSQIIKRKDNPDLNVKIKEANKIIKSHCL
ncbi:hypothetical protein QZH41_007144 [Actinostola sp. cb2023]|nr:hypothetical protein QZH41_007144 [Actinostola sp. cb2023]